MSSVPTSVGYLPEPESVEEPGTVYWITGLAGAGKTTLGRILHQRLRAARGSGVVLVDGDQMREVWGATAAHGVEERRRLSHGYSRLCRLLSCQGLDVVCCTVSMFHDVRAWNRAHLPRYREIFVRVPLAVLRLRDQKGLYSQADRERGGPLMGWTLAAEFPESPDLEVQNDGCRPAAVVVDEIWQALFPQPQEENS